MKTETKRNVVCFSYGLSTYVILRGILELVSAEVQTSIILLIAIPTLVCFILFLSYIGIAAKEYNKLWKEYVNLGASYAEHYLKNRKGEQ